MASEEVVQGECCVETGRIRYRAVSMGQVGVPFWDTKRRSSTRRALPFMKGSKDKLQMSCTSIRSGLKNGVRSICKAIQDRFITE